MIFSKCKYLVAGILFCFIPTAVEAAELIVTAPTSASVGELVQVTVSLDTQGERLNAVSGVIELGASSVVDRIEQVDSVVTLWLDPPLVPYGQIKEIPFSGAMIHGFSGVVEPGSQDKKPGELFTVYMVVTEEVVIKATSFSAYKHDGLGTKVESATAEATIAISSPGLATGDLSENLSAEVPMVVTTKVVTEPLLYDGQPTLLVSTQGGVGGVSYIEIKEPGSLDFIRIKNPYKLKNPNGEGKSALRVVDYDGNRTDVLVETGISTKQLTKDRRWSLAMIIFLPLITGLAIVVRRFL